MATLADSFLADLEDLSDDEPMAEGLEDMDQDQEDEVREPCAVCLQSSSVTITRAAVGLLSRLSS